MAQKVPRKELTFTSLPTDIISKILTFASDSTSKEASKLALTCKSWNAVLNPSCCIIMCAPGLPKTFYSSLSLLSRTNEGTSGRSFTALSQYDNKLYHVRKKTVQPASGLSYYMLREIVLLKNLSHPNIVPLKWVSVTKYCTIVQPLADHSMMDILQNKTVLSPSLVKKWMTQLFDGLAYCHSKHIVHRNLKPKHLVLFGKTVETSDLQISDFSLSRMLPIVNKKGQSVTNEVVTRWYRAPEIILGSKYYDCTIDIWSAGCIFAELLMGKALFPGATAIEVLFMIFQHLGTPTPAEWPELTTLPHYSLDKFPQFHCQSWKSIVPVSTTADRELLQACLTVNPARRASAEKILKLLKSTPSFCVNHPSQEFIYTNSSRHVTERWKLISDRLDYLLETEERTYAALRSAPKALERLAFSSKIDAFKSVRTCGVLSIYMITYDLTRSRFLSIAMFDSIYYIRGIDYLEPNGEAFAQIIVAIIMLAAKFVEGDVPTYNEMCRRLSIPMDSAITREENEILQILSLNMSFPTIVDYIDVLCTIRYGSVDAIPTQFGNALPHFYCLAIVLLDELEVSFPVLSIAVGMVRLLDCLNKCDLSNKDWEQEATLTSFCETWGVVWDHRAETCLQRMLSVWFYIAEEEEVKTEDSLVGHFTIAQYRLRDVLYRLVGGENSQTYAIWYPAMTKVKEHLLKEHPLR